jgi:ATP-dependent DNA helicase DinG
MSISRLVSKGIQPRAVQTKFIQSVLEAQTHPGKVSFIHADTGIGKSLGYLSAALDWIDAGFKVIIATQTHRLIRQLANIELPLIEPNIEPGLYFGLGRYVSKQRIEMLIATESYSNATIDYLAGLANFVGTIDDYTDEFGPLPEEISEHQLVCIHGDEDRDIALLRDKALKQSLIITTHSALVIDSIYKKGLFGVDKKTVVIVDEADAFIDFVDSSRYQTLSTRDVAEFIFEHAKGAHLTQLRNVMEHMEHLSHTSRTPIHIEVAEHFLSVLRELSKGRKKWQQEFRQRFQSYITYHADVCLTHSPVKQRPQIVISRLFVNKNVGDYLCQAHHAVLVSGTLSIKNDISGMDWAVSSLRLKGRTGVMAQFSPEVFGQLSFELAASIPNYPSIYVGNGEISVRWLNRVAQQIQDRTTANVVVLTGSHEESKLLEQALKNSQEQRHIARQTSGESIRVAVNLFNKFGGILITASGHTGLNLVQSDGELMFKDLVITRIGMAPKDIEKANFTAKLTAHFNGDNNIDALRRKHLNYEYSRNLVRTIRRLRQAMGRGIRSEQHQAHVIICDPRFPLYEHRDSKLAVLRESIPSRFIDAYKAASKQNNHVEVLF